MKNQIWKLIGSSAMLTGLAMLFTQCEANNAEMAQFESMSMAAMPATGNTTATIGYNAAQVCDCLVSNFAFEDLSQAEKDALLFMREEEKLARDVYLGLNEKWDARIFSNISKAEQRHMDAVLCLLDKYEQADPVGGNANGIFQNAALQALYTSLMEQGGQSLEAALIVGATIEDLDISDLLLRMPDMDNKDILAVFGELTKGSRNHLRAFNRNLETLGVTYVPQYINQEMFDEIINSPKEKGGSICGVCLGGGNGPGNGNGAGICNGTGPHGNAGNGAGNGTGTCNGTGPHGNGGGNGNGGGGNGNGGGGGGNGGGNGGGGNGNGGGN